LRLQEPSSVEIYELLAEGGSALVLSPPDNEKLSLPLGEIAAPADDLVHHTGKPSANNSPAELLPGTVRSLQAETIAKKLLLRLMRQSRTWISEQGVNVLFVTVGALTWKDSKRGDLRRAPLILVPVEIEEDGRKEAFRIERFEDMIEFNLTLVERIRSDFGFSIQPPQPEDGSDFDYQQVLEFVRTQVADREDFDVLEEVHVGLFPSYKLRIFTSQRPWELRRSSDRSSTCKQMDIQVGAHPYALPTRQPRQADPARRQILNTLMLMPANSA